MDIIPNIHRTNIYTREHTETDIEWQRGRVPGLFYDERYTAEHLKRTFAAKWWLKKTLLPPSPL